MNLETPKSTVKMFFSNENFRYLTINAFAFCFFSIIASAALFFVGIILLDILIQNNILFAKLDQNEIRVFLNSYKRFYVSFSMAATIAFFIATFICLSYHLIKAYLMSKTKIKVSELIKIYKSFIVNDILFLPKEIFRKLPDLPVHELTSIMTIKTERKKASPLNDNCVTSTAI